MANDTAARAFIQEASVLIAGQDFDRALSKLELADVELEDLSGEEKLAVSQLLKDAHASIASARASQHKPKYLRMIRNLMDSAESDIGNLVTWPGTERQLNELFADETAKAAIPDELAEAQPKFNTFRKLHARKAAAALTEQAEREVANAEEQWADTRQMFVDDPTSTNSYAVEKTQRWVADARVRLSALPAENDAVKALVARLDAVSQELNSVALSGQVNEMVAQLTRQFELYENEFGGWEEETGDGPTWDAYTRQSGESMSAFLAPRTRAFRERTESFLRNLDDDAGYQSVSSAPEVQAIVNDARTKLDAANAKLIARVRAVVSDANTANSDNINAFERLEGDVRRALGDELPESESLANDVRSRITAFETGVELAENADADQLEMLYARAEEVWPSLYAGLSWADGIDLTAVGQQIGFLAHNLMGYRFKPGVHYFATTIGGEPVAASIDAGMMAGITAIEEAIGRSLGDDDRDGKWDIVAVVTDKKGKLLAKREAESKGNIGGVDVSISTQYAEPVEAVMIEFLAARCGPFAGSKNSGVLRPDGTVSL